MKGGGLKDSREGALCDSGSLAGDLAQECFGKVQQGVHHHHPQGRREGTCVVTTAESLQLSATPKTPLAWRVPRTCAVWANIGHCPTPAGHRPSAAQCPGPHAQHRVVPATCFHMAATPTRGGVRAAHRDDFGTLTKWPADFRSIWMNTRMNTFIIMALIGTRTCCLLA